MACAAGNLAEAEEQGGARGESAGHSHCWLLRRRATGRAWGAVPAPTLSPHRGHLPGQDPGLHPPVQHHPVLHPPCATPP